jgi:hypothetical protein
MSEGMQVSDCISYRYFTPRDNHSLTYYIFRLRLRRGNCLFVLVVAEENFLLDRHAFFFARGWRKSMLYYGVLIVIYIRVLKEREREI